MRRLGQLGVSPNRKSDSTCKIIRPIQTQKHAESHFIKLAAQTTPSL
jgi:hypothetical protein